MPDLHYDVTTAQIAAFYLDFGYFFLIRIEYDKQLLIS
jgi:hypothetical protein